MGQLAHVNELLYNKPRSRRPESVFGSFEFFFSHASCTATHLELLAYFPQHAVDIASLTSHVLLPQDAAPLDQRTRRRC